MTEISSDRVSLSNSSPIITAITWYFGLWLFQALFQLIILGGKRRNKSIITNHTVKLLDDELYEATPYNRSYFKWSSIDNFVSFPFFLLFMFLNIKL